ncbi:hypothetical protein GA0115240_171112 [Streptomyces sp. DvalAA-14]|nr:hypothetical protein GA0115240_171112 [Streptomyces sp. DvalAA-14]
MRLIVRKERPHPGAQLRITDADGLRLTCFATNTADVPVAALELRAAGGVVLRPPRPLRGPSRAVAVPEPQVLRGDTLGSKHGQTCR